MKVYIKNIFNINKLTSIIFKKQEKLNLLDKKEKLVVYSKEGIFEIDQKNTYKLIMNLENTEQKVVNNLDFLIDNTVITKERIFQIPTEHISVPLLIFTYYLEKKTYIRLVIECVEDKESVKPIDYYFEIDTENTLDIINYIEDINVFLSMLN
jgi:hypothetical protein